MLKADLHIHSKGDPVDTHIQYTTQDIIKLAAKQNYTALAITWHNKVFDIAPIKSYAKKVGITLVQGTELTLEKKHTLLYNVTKEEVAKIKTFEDLYPLKDHVVVGAPHPFFMIPSCLGKTVFEHKELFDFMEYSHFYTKVINCNKKAVLAARQLHIPVVANSDAHHLQLFGKECTYIDAAPKAEAIIDALKKKATQKNQKTIVPQTRPYSFPEFLKWGLYFAPLGMEYFITRRFEKGKEV